MRFLIRIGCVLLAFQELILMNISTMFLRIYLKAPTKRSAVANLPIVELPNKRRIIIEEIEYDVTTLEDRHQRFITSYRLHRELGRHGEHMTLIGDFHTLDDVANILMQEASAPAEPLSVRRLSSSRG